MDKSITLSSGSHLCSDCGATFNSNSGLRKHINNKHKSTLKYRCSTCYKPFAEKHQLTAHLVQHGGAGVSCDVCEKKFTTMFAVKRHMAAVHESAKYSCMICSTLFADKDALKEHVAALHNQEYRYVCDFCGVKYRWRASLARHKAQHAKNGT